jgi:hypothetical protein
MSLNRKLPRRRWRNIRLASTLISHSAAHPTATDPSASPLFANLVHALKKATACRHRLSRLLPGVFGPTACARGKRCDPREAWRQEVDRAVDKVYRELDGLDTDPLPLSDNSSETGKASTMPEDLSELEHKDYLALAPEAQDVVKNEYSAWKTWEKMLHKYREAFEKQFPNWEQMDSPASAQLRHLWSVYQQSRLGLSRTTLAKGGLLAESAASDDRSTQYLGGDQFFADNIKVWGEPPPGVPPEEYFIRCSVLASRGLPWGYPSNDGENPSPAGGRNPDEGEK